MKKVQQTEEECLMLLNEHLVCYVLLEKMASKIPVKLNENCNK